MPNSPADEVAGAAATATAAAEDNTISPRDEAAAATAASEDNTIPPPGDEAAAADTDTALLKAPPTGTLSLELVEDDSQYKVHVDAMKRHVKACLEQKGPTGFSKNILTDELITAIMEHQKTLNKCYRVGVDFAKNVVTLSTAKLLEEWDIFVNDFVPEDEQHVKTLLKHYLLSLSWVDNVVSMQDQLEHVDIVSNELFDNVLTSRFSRGPNSTRVPVTRIMVSQAMLKAALGKEEKTSFNVDKAHENLDEYLKAERHSLLSNSNPGKPNRKDRLFIFTNDVVRSIQFEEQTPPELLRGEDVSVTRFLNFDENCTYTVDDRLFWEHTRFVFHDIFIMCLEIRLKGCKCFERSLRFLTTYNYLLVGGLLFIPLTKELLCAVFQNKKYVLEANLEVSSVSGGNEKTLQSDGDSLIQLFKKIKVRRTQCYNAAGIAKYYFPSKSSLLRLFASFVTCDAEYGYEYQLHMVIKTRKTNVVWGAAISSIVTITGGIGRHWDFLKKHVKNFETFIKENDKLTVNSDSDIGEGEPDHDEEGEDGGNANKHPAVPNAVQDNASTKLKAKKNLFLRQDKSYGEAKYKERKVSPNLGHVQDLGYYLLQVPRPRPDNIVTQKRSGNVKVLFADPDPVILYPKFAIDSEVTITGIPPPGTGVKLPDGTKVKRATWFPYERVGLNTPQYTKLSQINNVRARLNSQKEHFDEEEGLDIWDQCLKYVMEVVFPFYKEGNTDDIDHVWAMGIIMAYVLCSYPALKGTEDIQCYNNVERLKLDGHTFPPKQWCNLTPEARKHIKECIHSNPGNRPCLTSIWFNKWRTTTEEAIIEKYRRRYTEEADEQTRRKGKEDGNEKNIVHWLHLYKKCWKSPEDLKEYNNYPVPCGAWGGVK
eukprot:jgi/Psemu1/32661/gm1.32661_g